MKSSQLISFLVPDTGAPTIGAALKLARLLEPEYRTEIVGPDMGRGICSLYRDSYPFRAVPGGRIYRWPDYWWESRRLAREVKGDLIVAVKGFASTVPVAMRVKKERGVPVAVYLDEWDAALWHGLSFKEKCRSVRKHWHHPGEPCYLPWLERKIRQADTVLSTTTWLQKRFGGSVVHAGVDINIFKPQDKNHVAALKSSLGLAGKKVIVFGGVVRPHKGVEEILLALEKLADDRIRILVVGPITEHLDDMMKSARWGKWIVVAGDGVNAGTSVNADIHKQMPLYLDVGDLVVLPLRNSLLAQSQMPIKIFEALAMAKPIIGTTVADLPMVLDGCGKIVPAEDVGGLAEAIQSVFEDEALAAEMGRKAREKCIRKYSMSVTRKRLLEIMREMIG